MFIGETVCVPGTMMHRELQAMERDYGCFVYLSNYTGKFNNKDILHKFKYCYYVSI